MKFNKLFILAAAMFMSVVASAQIGIGTNSPDLSAVLDIVSTSKGMLIPRLTTPQRTGIATPATALQVYDTTTNSVWLYNGTMWVDAKADITFFGTANHRSLEAGTALLATSSNNIAIGRNALITATTGLRNIAIGVGAGRLVTGIENTVIGSQALGKATGDQNVAIGAYSMFDGVALGGNTAVGSFSGRNLASANNTAIGTNTLFAHTATGTTNNTALGNGALSTITSGINNVALGANAGSTGGATQIDSSVFLGAGAAPSAGTTSLTDVIAIGNAVGVSTSNIIALGRTNGQSRFGVNNSNPAAWFHINGAVNDNSLAFPATTAISRFESGVNGSLNSIDVSLRRFSAGAGAAGVNVRSQRTANGVAQGFIDYGIDGIDGSAGLGFGSNTTTHMVVAPSGNVGVGVTAPAAKLDVNGEIKIGNYTGTTPAAGMIRFDSATQKFQGYVGGTTPGWVDLN